MNPTGKFPQVTAPDFHVISKPPCAVSVSAVLLLAGEWAVELDMIDSLEVIDLAAARKLRTALDGAIRMCEQQGDALAEATK